MRWMLAAVCWLGLALSSTAQDPEPMTLRDRPKTPELTARELARVKQLMRQLAGRRLKDPRAKRLERALEKYIAKDPRSGRKGGIVVSGSAYDREYRPLRGVHSIEAGHSAEFVANARWDYLKLFRKREMVAAYGQWKTGLLSNERWVNGRIVKLRPRKR